jgi:hypothetical protein
LTVDVVDELVHYFSGHERKITPVDSIPDVNIGDDSIAHSGYADHESKMREIRTISGPDRHPGLSIGAAVCGRPTRSQP